MPLQVFTGDLYQGNILVSRELGHVGLNIMSYRVNMMRTNPSTTSVKLPEANLLKWHSRIAWFEMSLRSVRGIFNRCSNLIQFTFAHELAKKDQGLQLLYCTVTRNYWKN